LALTTVSALLVSEPIGFVVKQSMKTPARENSNPLGHTTQHPSLWRGRSEQISLDRVGWERNKILRGAMVFFLDFPFYRTSQDLSEQR
jgi:hypothetical protein